MNYGFINRSIRFKLPRYSYRSIWAYEGDGKTEQDGGNSQRSHHIYGVTIPPVVSCEAKETQMTLCSNSLLMTPIKCEQIFDMYFDTVFY